MEVQMNKLERFKRLARDAEWPSCFLCGEPVSTGFSLYNHDTGELEVTTVCDSCLKQAKSAKHGWIQER